MASFRDVYTREVEALFSNNLGRSRFEDIPNDVYVPQTRPAGDGNIQPAGYIADGVVDVASFASTIRPPQVVDALPTLPDTDYPQGSLVFLTTDEKLYRNTDGSTWSVEVDGEDIVANSITAGQIAAAAIGTDELAADAVIANVANVGDTVLIDEDGITISDGAIVLKDYSDETTLGAYGFTGPWLSFLADGFYNGSFDYGLTGTDLADTLGAGAINSTADYEGFLSTELPGWIISKQVGDSGQLRLFGDSTASGGFALRFDNQNQDALARFSSVIQDVPCLPGEELTLLMRWRYGATGAANEINRTVAYNFVDTDHDDVDTVVASGLSFTDAVANYFTEAITLGVAPATARFARIHIRFTAKGSGAALIDSLRLVRSVSVARLSSTADAELSSHDHALQIGPSDGLNLAADNNEIMARNNGAASTLNLNADGGLVTINNNNDDLGLDVNGPIEATNITLTDANFAVTLPGIIEFTERGDAGAPAANKGRLYLRDNGAGKTQLVIRFNSGAIQVIATQP